MQRLQRCCNAGFIVPQLNGTAQAACLTCCILRTPHPCKQGHPHPSTHLYLRSAQYPFSCAMPPVDPHVHAKGGERHM
jgi:hypothetical protein